MFTQNETIRVTVDYREAQSQVVDELRLMPGVEVKLAELKLGDYLIDDCCLFERKTLVDLAQSLKDGRLFSQAMRLAAQEPRAALILEGRGRDLIGSEMRREALLGAIVSLTLIYELPVLRSSEPAETGRIMLYAAGQLRRSQHAALPRHGRRPRGKHRLQLHILQGLPGIGPKRAEQLLATFGSVGAVMTASVEQLTQVEGLGQKTAEAIRAALG